MDDDNRVYVKILEEPAPKALRFRYECEGRSAGSLPGANSTHDRKTFPKIQVMGYQGRAVVVVSCVTIDPPYRPHPHNLVGKEGCKKGVCTLEISNEDMTCEFSNLGIQCVKKKDIEDSLKIREEIRVDPFRTGFTHKTQPGSIDLNSVRLCFQVFLQGPERGQFKIPVKPVVSEPIYDKKAISDLTIMKLSDCSSTVMGNKEIILLCDKVSKDDIEVRFFEESSDGTVIWEAFGDFQPSDVHKQYAISFRTPQYHQLEIDTPKRVQVQLRCPSKDTTSVPRPFEYIPVHQVKRKRRDISNSMTMVGYVNNVMQPQDPLNQLQQQQQQSQQPMMAFASPHQPDYQTAGMQQQQHMAHVPMQQEWKHVAPTGTSGGTVLGHPSNMPPVHNSYEPSNMDNISLPNLSDVNLSLLSEYEKSCQNLENNLSENISGLSLFDDNHQAKTMDVDPSPPDTNGSCSSSAVQVSFKKPSSKKSFRRKRLSDDEEEQDVVQDTDEASIQEKLENHKELRKLRQRPHGVNAVSLALGKKVAPEEETLGTGDPFKSKTGGMIDMEALKTGKFQSNDDAYDVGIGTQFSAETNTRDEDAEMLKYIEEELQKRKQDTNKDGANEPDVPKFLTPEEAALMAVPEYLRKSSSMKSEEMLSNQMLSGIPEVDLGVEVKIKNIIATEEAKEKILLDRLNKKEGPSQFVPTNMAVNFVQHNRFNIEEPAGGASKNKRKIKEPEKPKKVVVVGGEPEFLGAASEKEKGEKATDDFHFEKFKKQFRRF